MPYVGYKIVPAEHYVEYPSGYNYHFPKGGMCGEDEAVGDNGCTWKRHSRARMIYGENLITQNWNTTFVPDTPTNQDHTRRNIRVFQQTFDDVGSIVAGENCGVSVVREAESL